MSDAGAAVWAYLGTVAGLSPVQEALGLAVVAAVAGLTGYVARGFAAAAARWLERRRARRAIFKRFLAEVEILKKMMGDSVKSSSLDTLEREIDAHAALGKPFRVFVVLVTDDDAQREMETILALFDRATIRKVQEFLLLSRYFEESLRMLGSDAFAALRPTRQKAALADHFGAGRLLAEAAGDLAATLSRHPWAERALRPPPNPGCGCLSREWGRNRDHGDVSDAVATPRPASAAQA
jgi:hypothetical protein